MEQVILKNKLEWVDKQVIQVPENGNFISVQIQNGSPVLWSQHEVPYGNLIPMKVLMAFSGVIFEDHDFMYFGTLQNGSIVYHVFIDYNSYVRG
jgi:hypothetical protein